MSLQFVQEAEQNSLQSLAKTIEPTQRSAVYF
jgi:hypothetical protein